MPAMTPEQSSLVTRILRRLNLRFPGLFVLLLLITLADLAIPDFIPFVDEVGLALITLLLGSWKNRKAEIPPDDMG